MKLFEQKFKEFLNEDADRINLDQKAYPVSDEKDMKHIKDVLEDEASNYLTPFQYFPDVKYTENEEGFGYTSSDNSELHWSNSEGFDSYSLELFNDAIQNKIKKEIPFKSYDKILKDVLENASYSLDSLEDYYSKLDNGEPVDSQFEEDMEYYQEEAAKEFNKEHNATIKPVFEIRYVPPGFGDTSASVEAHSYVIGPSGNRYDEEGLDYFTSKYFTNKEEFEEAVENTLLDHDEWWNK